MHIHHLHMILFHARLVAGNLRFLAAILFLLLSGVPGGDGARTALDLLEAKHNHAVPAGASCSCCTADGRAASGAVVAAPYPGAIPAYPGAPDMVATESHTSAFDRLQPGIVLLPRMHRTPKPKSVYRVLARAPGGLHLLSCPEARTVPSGAVLI